MEFGRLSPEELETVDFRLPPDHRGINALKKQKRVPEIRVGCAKWGRKDWVGTIYPQKTREPDFLSHYAKHFNSIELNATFYKIPSKTQTATWSRKVGGDFLFCPKFSQSITHIRRLKNAAEAADRFLDGVSGFGKNLGPLFLMPHPQMGPKTIDTIDIFLESIPDDFEVFVEVRHPEWYKEESAMDELCNVLQKHHAGTVITDAAGRRDCLHMRLTNGQAFIRFVGNGLHPSDYTRIDDWVQRIKQWIDLGVERVFFFMHQHDELHSPVLCKYLIEELNIACDVSIPLPQFENESMND